MAYSDIKNGMKGTPMSLEQRATANKMNMFNKRPSPLEQAMMPKGNFETIAPPKGIFEPPVKPRMDMIGDIRKKQMPDMESPYMPPKPMQGGLAPPPKQPMGMPPKQPMGLPPQGDILTQPKDVVAPPPVGMPPPPKQPIAAPMGQPIIQSDVVNVPDPNIPKGGVSPPPIGLAPPPKQPIGGTTAQPIVESDVINVPPPNIPKGNIVPPPIGGVTPPIIPPKGGGLPPPPMGGGGLPSQPEIGHGGTSPTVPSVPAAQPSVPAEQPWQDNTVGAGTSSFQNPYTNISGEMGSGFDYLRGQGIDIGDEYSKYFGQYDTAREQGAMQQYGFGQDASMAAARSNLMQMTQQGLGSGFGGVGFGGAGASGARSQFGLGAQQAGLSLRGDIHGMRRDQEDDWWDTLASVEQRRGEMFGTLSAPTNTYVDPYAEDVPSEAQGDPDWVPPANPTQGDTYLYNETAYYWDEGQQEWSQDI